ncbi:MAG: cytidylate kinase-like family protein [Eubacteriales bacterium]
MSNIITISREFGSGGREVGKRLADLLQIPYYDNEIISRIAEESGLSEVYVAKNKSNISHSYPISVGRTFISPPLVSLSDQIFQSQCKIIRQLGEEGPCVIVGRCGDFFLKDQSPLSIYIHADLEDRISRCYEKGYEDVTLSHKEMKNKVVSVDKNRRKYYEYYTGQKWHQLQNYSVCISTSRFGVKGTAKVLAGLYEIAQERPNKGETS